MADQIGKGAVLSVSDSDANYQAIAKVVDMKPPPPKVAKVETTDYDDTCMKHIPGWEDPGEAEAKIKYNKSQAATVRGYLAAAKFWQITMPDGGLYKWQGFMSEFGTEVPIKDKVMTTIKIVATTSPTTTIS